MLELLRYRLPARIGIAATSIATGSLGDAARPGESVRTVVGLIMIGIPPIALVIEVRLIAARL